MEPEKNTVLPITMPGVHSRVYPVISGLLETLDRPVILDAGAGHGAMTKRLYEEGFEVMACDLDPVNFQFSGVECKQADITKHLPFDDGQFDVVLLIEVMEHIPDHQVLLGECFRVLKPEGFLFFSTPNIVSLKSRMRFLLTGFHYAFKPLEHDRSDGRQHVAGLTVDQYAYLARKAGFSVREVTIDKKQRSSRWLFFLLPAIWIWCRLKGIPFSHHNRWIYLTGRLLIFILGK